MKTQFQNPAPTTIDADLFTLLVDAQHALTFYMQRDSNPKRADQTGRICENIDMFIIKKSLLEHKERMNRADA